MKKALMYASVASMIQQFNMDNIRLLIEQGYQVDVACNMEQGSTISDAKIAATRAQLEAMGCRVQHIPVPRKITALGAIGKSFRMTREQMNREQYDLVHCHSPIGGMICRLANRFSTGYRRTKMVYTAHGFHFFKGAPVQNWLLFFPVEWLCARFTDVLITINREDYETAKRTMRAKQVVYVPGVGIQAEQFSTPGVTSQAQRAALGIPEDAFVLTSVGELNQNKNQSVILRAMARLARPNVHYIIVGQGAMEQELRQLSAELKLSEQVHLLGYRTDVPQIYAAADVCAFPSVREGLGLAALEGMAAGLPLLCADNRGTRDYAENGKNACICDAASPEEFAEAIARLMDMPANARREMAQAAREKAEQFDVKRISVQMAQIYGALQQQDA